MNNPISDEVAAAYRRAEQKMLADLRRACLADQLAALKGILSELTDDKGDHVFKSGPFAEGAGK